MHNRMVCDWLTAETSLDIMPPFATIEHSQPGELRTYSSDSMPTSSKSYRTTPAETEATIKSFSPTTQFRTNGLVRAQSSHVQATKNGGIPQLNRWKSESGMSEQTQRRNFRPEGRAPTATNRESMKDLAEFLKTKEPPPSNWMSSPPDEERNARRASFNMFGRNKSKVDKTKLLKLPDSAVAATTSSGSRHIAISIPLRGWPDEHPEVKSVHVGCSKPPKLPLGRAAVTVLKPVVEARESSSHNSPPKSNGNGEELEKVTSQADPDALRAADEFGSETKRTIKYYYNELNRHSTCDTPSSSGFGSPRSQSTQNTVPRNEIITRRDSQLSNPRSSGGTVYTSSSSATTSAHSRETSSVSTAHSATTLPYRNSELPQRNSSLPRNPPTIQSVLTQTSKAGDNEPRDSSRVSTVLPVSPVSERTTSVTNTSPTPASVADTVSTTQSNDAGKIALQKVQGTTTEPVIPSPTRQLPDLPQSSIPPRLNSAISSAGLVQGSSKGVLRTRYAIQDDWVEAGQAREMAILPIRSPSRTSHSVSKPKKRAPSQDLSLSGASITLSPIMIVASQSPTTSPTESAFTDPQHRSDFLSSQDSLIPSVISQCGSLSKSKSSPRDSLFTSSCSLPSSAVLDSDSDTVPYDRTPKQKRTSTFALSTRSSQSLEARRQERRFKRNVTIKEKEMDARVAKLEKDNRALLSMLSRIERRFKEMDGLYVEGGESGEEAGLDL